MPDKVADVPAVESEDELKTVTEGLKSVEEAEKASEASLKPGEVKRESDPVRVAQAVASAAPEVRAPVVEPPRKTEGDTVLPWASAIYTTTLTHVSLEMPYTISEATKATRRHLN